MNKFQGWAITLLSVFCLQLSGTGFSAEEDKLTIAFFDFQAKDRNAAKLGEVVRDLSEAFLSANDNVRVVTRSDMLKILQENKLEMAGLTSESAPKIGKLLGAQVMIVGRVNQLNEKVYISSRIISVETSRAFASVVKGSQDDVDALVEGLAEKIMTTIEENEDKFKAKVVKKEDQIKALKKEVGDKNLPQIYVYVPEKHITAPTVDPAAQTEIETILNKSGFELHIDKKGKLKTWAKGYLSKSSVSAPTELSEVNVIIVGEGFSEFATRTGELITCKARVELKAIDPISGKVLAVDRETFRATDLSEHIAAKTALQNAAAKLTFRMTPGLVKKWREQKKAKKK